MQSYKLIQGNNTNVKGFEEQVSNAINEGYEFCSDLITQGVTKSNGSVEVLFFQPMALEDKIYFEDEEEEEVDDDEDEEK